MRIVSWNSYRGECRKRAALLHPFQPDIAVLQECGKPEQGTNQQCLWFGDRPIQGVGVVSFGPWTIEAGPVDIEVTDSAYPVIVRGPYEFNLLAVWTKPRPTYVRALLNALCRYREFLQSKPSVIVGDFNSHSRWDNKDPEANHSVLVKALEDEYGLTSAYHVKHGTTEEKPTLYWYWRDDQPFHIDYCFIPKEWATILTSVEVGGFSEWARESDHRPLAVDIALESKHDMNLEQNNSQIDFNKQSIEERIETARREIAEGKGVNWRNAGH